MAKNHCELHIVGKSCVRWWLSRRTFCKICPGLTAKLENFLAPGFTGDNFDDTPPDAVSAKLFVLFVSVDGKSVSVNLLDP